MKEHLKKIATLLSFILLIQSCTVYKATNFSLDYAANTESRVKIILKNGDVEKFSKVELFDDGEYYGKKKHFLVGPENVVLKKDNIQKVQVADKTASAIINGTGIVVGSALGFIGFWLLLWEYGY
ncbi:hypothetical protein [Aestuariivivens sediminis]|uniref:hypothetical protein n=1 Tax=Aestuariivivens sediminis TaxID=2913557 RepID=UPI001F584853|nr:hypothetical protein [Aestuariivivens sediminis]